MPYSYDQYGYLADTPIPERATDVAPPDPADWPAGQRPNWTGYAWIYLDYPPPAPPPAPGARILSRLQFLERFQQAELAAILAAAQQSAAIQVWIKMLEMAGEVDLDSPRTAGGVHALEQAGLLAPGRAALILGDGP